MNSPCTQIRHAGPVESRVSEWALSLPHLQYFLDCAFRWCRDRRAQIAERRLIETYLALDDRGLEDIGLCRSDVTHVLQLPLSISASRELDAIRTKRTLRYRLGVDGSR